MKVKDIFRLAIEKGIEFDPRGPEGVKRMLEKEKKRFNDLKEDDKKFFDQDKLDNPYSDSRLLTGDPEKEVRAVLVGVDMEVGEVLLADRLRERGRPVDLIIAHHPEGKAMSALYQVMHLQEDILVGVGVPVNVAEGIMASRIGEVKRGLMPLNHNRAVDAARLMDFPLMCLHTPADNLVNNYVQKMIDEKSPDTLMELVKLIRSIPEYEEATRYNAGPTIIVGSGDRRTGKVLVDFTGGTSGSQDAYGKLSAAGVGTLVVMHMGEKHKKEAEKNHINVIIAGHMASDSLGINLILDDLEKAGVEIIPCAGLIRHSRN